MLLFTPNCEQSISVKSPFNEIQFLLSCNLEINIVYMLSVSKQETWAEAANRIIQKSQGDRTKSRRLRSESESLVNRIAQEMWDTWNSTNNALTRRSSEMLEAKSKLQQHLQKVSTYDKKTNVSLFM